MNRPERILTDLETFPLTLMEKDYILECALGLNNDEDAYIHHTDGLRSFYIHQFFDQKGIIDQVGDNYDYDFSQEDENDIDYKRLTKYMRELDFIDEFCLRVRTSELLRYMAKKSISEWWKINLIELD